MRRAGEADAAAFRSLIEEHIGFHCDGLTTAELDALLQGRLRATGSADLTAYRTLLASPVTRRVELAELAQRITVGETYFFREPHHFEVLTQVVAPERMRRRPAGDRMRVLSVGCSSGEETYSLAISLREALGPEADRAAIQGIDVHPGAVERARRAWYSKWALRSTPDELRARYFRPEGPGYTLLDEIRRDVLLEERNLFEEDPAFWVPASIDVIFCRNVIMYFSPNRIRDAVERFANALVPGGYLFLGHSETLHGVSNTFETVHGNGTFCYVRRASMHPPAPPPRRAGNDRPRPRVAANPPASPTSWIDAIDGAWRHVDALASRSRAPTPRALEGGLAPPKLLARCAADPRAALEGATALFRAERFQEALAMLDRDPQAFASSAEIQLVRAAILTNQGSFAAAEETCHTILSLDPWSPSARYLLAICRAQGGDLAQAAELHRRAIEIDPAFAMSHMQIGMLARRGGDRAAARASLRAALRLLEQEDSPTLTLLCGGFSRWVLIEMCRAELAVCGETP